MIDVYDDDINEIVNPMYEAILDDKAGFSANDVYDLQKLLTYYVDDLESIEEDSNKEELVLDYTKSTVEDINKMNKDLMKFGFILDSDRDNLIKFFNEVAKDFGYDKEEDITKAFRDW